MANCSCGAPLNPLATLCRRCSALAVLGVSRDAAFKEVREAYQLLVKVWHPDRFQSDRAILDSVDARMKEVNSAFAFLKEHPDPVRLKDRDARSPFAQRETQGTSSANRPNVSSHQFACSGGEIIAIMEPVSRGIFSFIFSRESTSS